MIIGFSKNHDGDIEQFVIFVKDLFIGSTDTNWRINTVHDVSYLLISSSCKTST